jgi:hypothetical protein
MAINLDPDYEEEHKVAGVFFFFWETINTLGGWTGFAAIAFVLVLFLQLVSYILRVSRKKRESKRK